MAVPSYIAKTTGTGSVDALTITLPAHQENDILLLFLETAAQAISVTTVGWAELPDSPQTVGGTTTGTRISAWWKRAASSSETNPTTTDSGNHQYGVVVVVRGCTPGGNPWNITGGSTKSVASGNCSIPGVTTTEKDCLVVYVASRPADNAGAFYTGEANASLTNLTERHDAGTTEGNGGGLAIWTGEKATAGATGTLTASIQFPPPSPYSTIEAYYVIALRPSLETTAGPEDLSLADWTSGSNAQLILNAQVNTEGIRVIEDPATGFRGPHYWQVEDFAITDDNGSVQSGTYIDTWDEDGNKLFLEDDPGVVPGFRYEFVWNRVPENWAKSVRFVGRYTGVGESIVVYQWDYTNSLWEPLLTAGYDIPTGEFGSYTTSLPLIDCSGDYWNAGQITLQFRHYGTSGTFGHELIIDELQLSPVASARPSTEVLALTEGPVQTNQLRLDALATPEALHLAQFGSVALIGSLHLADGPPEASLALQVTVDPEALALAEDPVTAEVNPLLGTAGPEALALADWTENSNATLGDEAGLLYANPTPIETLHLGQFGSVALIGSLHLADWTDESRAEIEGITTLWATPAPTETLHLADWTANSNVTIGDQPDLLYANPSPTETLHLAQFGSVALIGSLALADWTEESDANIPGGDPTVLSAFPAPTEDLSLWEGGYIERVREEYIEPVDGPPTVIWHLGKDVAPEMLALADWTSESNARLQTPVVGPLNVDPKPTETLHLADLTPEIFFPLLLVRPEPSETLHLLDSWLNNPRATVGGGPPPDTLPAYPNDEHVRVTDTASALLDPLEVSLTETLSIEERAFINPSQVPPERAWLISREHRHYGIPHDPREWHISAIGR